MREILLTQGKVALVDDQDFDMLSSLRWHATTRGYAWYARRNARGLDGKACCVLMHRMILNAPYGVVVDHCDGNGLNNQRENLRLCTLSQNHANQGRRRDSGNNFKGIKRNLGKWHAAIKVNRKAIHLGTFDTPEEAAHAYNVAAILHFGEFARLNDMQANPNWQEPIATVA